MPYKQIYYTFKKCFDIQHFYITLSDTNSYIYEKTLTYSIIFLHSYF